MNLEEEETAFLRNVTNHSTKDRESHPKTPNSSTSQMLYCPNI